MPRTKGGVVARRRRNKILKLAKGYFGSKSTLYRTAHEQVMHSLQYAYRDRKNRKRDFRKLWIIRINAAARLNSLTYNQLMFGLKLIKAGINRKMLADLAVNDMATFSTLCQKATKAIDKAKK